MQSAARWSSAGPPASRGSPTSGASARALVLRGWRYLPRAMRCHQATLSPPSHRSDGKAREGSSIVVTMEDVRIIKKFCDADKGAPMTAALTNEVVRARRGRWRRGGRVRVENGQPSRVPLTHSSPPPPSRAG